MKMQRSFAVSVGSIVLSAGLVLVGPVSAENSTTIDHTTQPHLKSWSNVIPKGTKRFIVLADFNSQAVLDRETGLVWEQAPDAINTYHWAAATVYCVNKNVGGTVGWRLPSVVELNSVRDLSLAAPFVPTSVFSTNVLPADYWSATTLADNSPSAWYVSFLVNAVTDNGKFNTFYAWCVRGPMNADAY